MQSKKLNKIESKFDAMFVSSVEGEGEMSLIHRNLKPMTLKVFKKYGLLVDSQFQIIDFEDKILEGEGTFDRGQKFIGMIMVSK